MGKQRGGNRGILISIAVVVVITGIVIGVLFATGVLGKKSGGSPSVPSGTNTNFVPPTPGQGTPGSVSDNPLITNVTTKGGKGGELDLEIEYNSSTTAASDTGVTLEFYIDKVPPPNTYYKTFFTTNSVSVKKVSEGSYIASFVVDGIQWPPGTYPGTVSIATCHTCISNLFNFNFQIY